MVLENFIGWLDKSKVAYHEHEGWQEHPVAVKYHQEYFSGKTAVDKKDILVKIPELISGRRRINLIDLFDAVHVLEEYIKTEAEKGDRDYVDALRDEFRLSTAIFKDSYEGTGAPGTKYIHINSARGTEAMAVFSLEKSNRGQIYLSLEELATHPRNLRWNPNKEGAIRGSGTRAIQEVVKIAKKANAKYIKLMPIDEAIPYYEKIGFETSKKT